MGSRSEGVPPSRKRGSEEGGLPDPGKDAMLEHADGSELCISEMAVILMSQGVAPANSKEAELFCRNTCGSTAVDMGFQRGLVVDHLTGWMNDSVAQQRLHTEQRVSPAGEQPSVVTRVEAAKEGPDEAVTQALAASSVREVSVATDADMVDNKQMGEGKPMSLVGSPMCQTFCGAITVMRDANGVSEVQCGTLVERCVKHPEEKGMDGVQRNAGRLVVLA